MSGLRRSVHRATARRNGIVTPKRDNGEMVAGSVRGYPRGSKCFDYQFVWRPGTNHTRDTSVVAVHFRHPTKRRTAGRVCNALFVQPHQMIVERAAA